MSEIRLEAKGHARNEHCLAPDPDRLPLGPNALGQQMGRTSKVSTQSVAGFLAATSPLQRRATRAGRHQHRAVLAARFAGQPLTTTRG
jgi:hypothetical protein